MLCSKDSATVFRWLLGIDEDGERKAGAPGEHRGKEPDDRRLDLGPIPAKSRSKIHMFISRACEALHRVRTAGSAAVLISYTALGFCSRAVADSWPVACHGAAHQHRKFPVACTRDHWEKTQDT